MRISARYRAAGTRWGRRATILPPVVIPLVPDPGNDMCGRSGFLIHGDNRQFPGWASDGCIVIGDPAKCRAIVGGGIDRLEVVS